MAYSDFYTPTFSTTISPATFPPDTTMVGVVTSRPLNETRFPRIESEFDKNYRDLFGRSPSKRIDRSRSNRQHRISAAIRPQQRRPRTPPGRRAPAPNNGRRPNSRRSKRRIARHRSPTRRRPPSPKRSLRRRSRSRRRSRTQRTIETPPPSPRNKSDSSLSRELRADFTRNRPFAGFTRVVSPKPRGSFGVTDTARRIRSVIWIRRRGAYSFRNLSAIPEADVRCFRICG